MDGPNNPLPEEDKQRKQQQQRQQLSGFLADHGEVWIAVAHVFRIIGTLEWHPIPDLVHALAVSATGSSPTHSGCGVPRAQAVALRPAPALHADGGGGQEHLPP